MTITDYINTDFESMRLITDRIATKFRLDRDDLMQECVIHGIKYGHKYVNRDSSGFKAWWNQLCYRKAIDIYRVGRSVSFASKYPQMPTFLISKIDERARLALIFRVIRQRFGTRTSLVMYLLAYEYQYDEIATELKMTIGTVRSTIFRCREYLENVPTIAHGNPR